MQMQIRGPQDLFLTMLATILLLVVSVAAELGSRAVAYEIMTSQEIADFQGVNIFGHGVVNKRFFCYSYEMGWEWGLPRSSEPYRAVVTVVAQPLFLCNEQGIPIAGTVVYTAPFLSPPWARKQYTVPRN